PYLQVNSNAALRQASSFVVSASDKCPRVFRIRLCETVNRFSHFTAEDCGKPDDCPSAVDGSIRNCVGSVATCFRLVVTAATMVVISFLFKRSHWTTTAGRSL